MTKASLEQVKKEISPYVVKRLLGCNYIEGKDVQRVTDMLRRRYSNVETHPRPINGKAMYIIKVKGFLNGGTLSYEIRNNGIRPKVNDRPSNLDWIDRLEEIDAALDD